MTERKDQSTERERERERQREREPEGGAQPPGRVPPDEQAAGARGGRTAPWQGPAG